MRHFTYTGGSSDKFWEIERDGTSVTVRFGRIGTNGQAQTKEFDSEADATAHVDRLVAEKVKKGYAETGSGAPAPAPRPAKATPAKATPAKATPVEATPAEATAIAADEPVTLPDEDTFEIPASWRRSLHPRRDGVRVPSPPLGRDPVAAAERVLATVRPIADTIVGNPAGDRDLTAAARRYVRDGPGHSEVTPLGAGAVATIVLIHLDWRRKRDVEVFADAWIATRGVVFAARAVAEAAAIGLDGGPRAGGREVDYYLIRRGDDPHDYGYGTLLMARKVRAHLAAAPEAEYRAAVEALAACRRGPLRQRVVTSFLVATHAEWVDEDITAWARSSTTGLGVGLLCAVGSAQQFERVAPHVNGWEVARSMDTITTCADAVGPAIAPALAGWFDGYADADSRKRLLTVLAALPTDEAFRLLVDRLDQKYVQPAVYEAAGRYPVRALRLLSVAAAGQSTVARLAAEVLRTHVVGNPEIVAAARDSLPAQVRERVDAIAAATTTAPEAPPDLLPPVLVTPPWIAKRARAKPAVLPDLAGPAERRMVWHDGERESWRGSDEEANRYWLRDSSWTQKAADYRANRMQAYEQPWFFAVAPEDVVRPLLADWRPPTTWYAHDWMKRIVARYELAALPAALHVAKLSPTSLADTLLPYAAPEVADAMADWLARLKTVRGVALAWLGRHPAAAAAALVPASLARPGAARRAAENALRALAAAGHGARVHDAARTHGPAVTEAVDAFLATDPLDLLPARAPTVDWADPALLPQVLLRDRAHALPRAAFGHVCTMLAMSKPDEVYAGVAIVKEACDPDSLAEFGWALFERWRAMGAPSKDGWVLDALGWLGNDDTVRRLAPVIRAWPGEGGHTRAVAGLDVLAAIGTDVALMHLHGISERVKFKALKDRAKEKMAEVAADLGLRPEQLADWLVPDLGLDADGSLTLDYGPRRFTVGFDEQLKPYVADADGKRRTDLPKPGARDDGDLASASYKRFAALKKDVRTIAADQIRRLEQAMVLGRRWSGREFRGLFVAHPLLWHIVRRLVWGVFDGDGGLRTALRVAEDRSYADVADETSTVDDAATVGIAHPLHLGADLAAWSEVFADYEILQPFPQLGREVYTLTDDERAATGLARFTGVKVPTTKVLGLERRGWRRGAPQDAGIQSWMERVLPNGHAVVVGLDPGIAVGMVNEFPEQQLESVWINNRPTGDWSPRGTLTFGGLDPVTASEILRDLTEVTA